MLKAFLLITGLSVVAFVISVLAHNAMSAWLGFEEPVFFILAAIVCPIGLLVGGVGSIVLAIRNKPPKYSGQNV